MWAFTENGYKKEEMEVYVAKNDFHVLPMYSFVVFVYGLNCNFYIMQRSKLTSI